MQPPLMSLYRGFDLTEPDLVLMFPQTLRRDAGPPSGLPADQPPGTPALTGGTVRNHVGRGPPGVKAFRDPQQRTGSERLDRRPAAVARRRGRCVRDQRAGGPPSGGPPSGGAGVGENPSQERGEEAEQQPGAGLQSGAQRPGPVLTTVVRLRVSFLDSQASLCPDSPKTGSVRTLLSLK